MAHKTEIEIISAIFCDEVRKEASGKDIIIGASPNGVSVLKFPAKIRGSFWINAKATNVEKKQYSMKVELRKKSTEEIVYGVEIGISANEAAPVDYFVLTPPRFILNIDCEEIFSLFFSFEDGKFKHIVDIPINKAPNSPPSI
jgi:hypothetical protein